MPPTAGWSIGGYPQQPAPGQPTRYPQNFPPGFPQYGGPYNPYPRYGGAHALPPSIRLAPLACFGAKVLHQLLLPPLILAAVILLAATSTDATYDADTGMYSSGGALTVGVILILLLFAGLIVFSFYQLYRQGAAGQTIGNQVVDIRVICEADGRPTGLGMAFVRNMAHFPDSIALYIGWLWSLWDAKKQTFADKVCTTLVVLA